MYQLYYYPGNANLAPHILLVLTVSHFRGNPAAMNFVGGKQAQTGCDFGF